MYTDKEDIVNNIHKRFSGQVSKLTINDSANIICDYLIESLITDRSVFIHNFGTLHTYKSPPFINLSGEPCEPVRNVKFSSHSIFDRLISDKKEIFKKKNNS